ncbi:Protein of unknown function [Gryllus bimaculatus]|nr:Protein of unknown function [Gryllus bimaculatus]
MYRIHRTNEGKKPTPRSGALAAERRSLPGAIPAARAVFLKATLFPRSQCSQRSWRGGGELELGRCVPMPASTARLCYFIVRDEIWCL